MKFRSKPCEIEAVQFTGSNAFEIWSFMGREDLVLNPGLLPTDHPVIRTPEGDMTASPGDWIVKGLKGEFYPVKPDIFEMKHEPVDHAASA